MPAGDTLLIKSDVDIFYIAADPKNRSKVISSKKQLQIGPFIADPDGSGITGSKRR